MIQYLAYNFVKYISYLKHFTNFKKDIGDYNRNELEN